MKSYPIREMARMTEDEIWALDNNRTDPIEIHFDDGILHTRAQPTIFSWYIWQLFSEYDKSPILLKHHIQNTRVSSTTHLNYFTSAVTSIFEAYNKKVDMDALAKRVYELTNAMFNAFVLRLGEEVTSIDILDFIEVTDHLKWPRPSQA